MNQTRTDLLDGRVIPEPRSPYREQAYQAIDSERAYQNFRWGPDHDTHNPHSVAEWVLYMEHYLVEARRVLTTQNDPEAGAEGLAMVRKITALGVVCMEQHGAPRREGF